jgi:hypothetical protein
MVSERPRITFIFVGPGGPRGLTMKKLSMFSLLAIASLAGCPKGDKDKTPDPAKKPEEATKTDTGKKDETGKDTVKKDDATKPEQVAIADLPAECNDYKAAIDKAAACEKLGAQRDQLKADLEKSWAAWAKLDKAGKDALKDSCKQLTTTVTTALEACK